MMKIYGFIHVLGNNRGQDIVLEQLDRLKKSGLWDKTENIFIGSVGDEINLPDDSKIIHTHDPDALLYERFTLNQLYRRCCEDQSCLVWYIHSKGASWSAHDPRWRHHMENHVIDGYSKCITALNSANTCGPLGLTTPEPFYAGNFWWARADYVKNLIPPDDWSENTVSRDGTERYSCETWIIQANYHLHLFLSYGPPLLKKWTEPLRDVIWMYKRYDEIVKDVHSWCETSLPQISAVCGIPRSGVLVAYLISQYRNIPMATIDSLVEGKVTLRRDGRPQRFIDGPVLIVDDTCASGATMDFQRQRINVPNIIYGALYSIFPNKHVDVYGYSVTTGYHTFESNFLRDGLAQDYVCDLDGVFRKNWTGTNEDEQVEDYKQF